MGADGAGTGSDRVRALIEDERPSTGQAGRGRPHPTALPGRGAALPATGVAVSLIAETGNQVTVAASGALTERLEELQFSRGGPRLEAYATRSPVPPQTSEPQAAPMAGLPPRSAAARRPGRLRVPAADRRGPRRRDGRLPRGDRRLDPEGFCLRVDVRRHRLIGLRRNARSARQRSDRAAPGRSEQPRGDRPGEGRVVADPFHQPRRGVRPARSHARSHRLRLGEVAQASPPTPRACPTSRLPAPPEPGPPPPCPHGATISA